MFLVDMTFTNMDEITEDLTLQHRNYLAEAYKENKLLFGGRKDPRTGGIIIALHEEEDDLKELLDSDPFVVRGVTNYSLTKFTPVMVCDQYPELLSF